MCDREHYERLEGRVDALEDSVAVYHAKTDERLKTLFQMCERLSSTAATMLKASLALLGTVLIVAVFALVYGAVVAVFALVYGAVGGDGFNAVAPAAASAVQEVLK